MYYDVSGATNGECHWLGPVLANGNANADARGEVDARGGSGQGGEGDETREPSACSINRRCLAYTRKDT
eukprot:756461-Prorocentrum_minimum.AAC.1